MTTVSSAFLANFVESCIALGAPADSMYALVPGGRRALDLPDCRFAGEVVIAVLEGAALATGNDTVGLRVGMQFRPATFLDVGYALSSAGTIRQALEINMRFQAQTQEIVTTRLEICGVRAAIRCTPAIADTEAMRRVMEAVFAGYASIGRWLLRDHSQPIIQMQFRHRDPGPQCGEAYRMIFGETVCFGASEDMLIIHADLITVPLPNEDQDLVRLLSRRLEARLKLLREDMTLSGRVRNCLHGQLHRGRPSFARTAEMLGFSERTLRRRLACEGEQFADLLQQVRREAAEVYVREGKMTLCEIAQALGYGDQSAFVRAFRAWYGVPPGIYRRQTVS